MAKKSSDPAAQSITWESVRRELNSSRTDQGKIDYDKVRRQKLSNLAAHTKRPAVLYATEHRRIARSEPGRDGFRP